MAPRLLQGGSKMGVMGVMGVMGCEPQGRLLGKR